MTRERITWLQRLQNFDRRWLFLIMAAAIVGPMLRPINIPIVASPMVHSAYNQVEALKEGDIVFVSLDLDPASTPELEPFYRAVILHLKRKNVKLVFATNWYQAPPMVQAWFKSTLDVPIVKPGDGYKGPPDRAYKPNVDYVYLGFREGKQATISNMGADLRKTFDNRANDGTPLDEIPMMNGIKSLKDFKLVVAISAGFPGAKEYVLYVQSRYALPMIAACTAVSLTDLAPYYQSGQLLGLVGGLVASAEYETLVGKKDIGTKGADVLNVGHLVVILAIVLGNVIFFLTRRQQRRGQVTP